MDPNACFQRFVDAMCAEDFTEAYVTIKELSGWYVRSQSNAQWPGSDVTIHFEFVNQMVAILGTALLLINEDREPGCNDDYARFNGTE